MKKYPSLSLLVFLFALLSACAPAAPSGNPPPASPVSASQTPTKPSAALTNPPAPTLTPSPLPTPSFPPIPDSQPSERVAAFYYPWYRNPQVDGSWVHWEQGGLQPPNFIAADFYPALGAYSSTDPAVVAQHFAWLRQARVGLIVTSWWGIGSREDQVTPLLLEMGERYGVKVAFHIEPYGGRTASSLVDDIRYLYESYGNHPAFYRTFKPSRWSPDERSKGLFFLWAARFPDGNSAPVEPEYWQPAIDQIHALPDGGIVLADENDARWVDGGHFDGLYNYGVLDSDLQRGYNWGRDLPPGAWYVPGINPGFSGERIGLPDNLNTPRQDGATYDLRWEMALGMDIEPALAAIVSFNEWHEGHQIEPAAPGTVDGAGKPYQDYGALPPDGYLARTAEWVERFLSKTWSESVLLRVRLETTSDWTTFSLLSGAAWQRPDLVSVTGQEARTAFLDNLVELGQPLLQAESGKKVEMVFDILISGWQPGGVLTFKIERGAIGMTVVEFSRLALGEATPVKSVRWGGFSDERNSFTFEVNVEELLGK